MEEGWCEGVEVVLCAVSLRCLTVEVSLLLREQPESRSDCPMAWLFCRRGEVDDSSK